MTLYIDNIRFGRGRVLTPVRVISSGIVEKDSFEGSYDGWQPAGGAWTITTEWSSDGNYSVKGNLFEFYIPRIRKTVDLTGISKILFDFNALGNTVYVKIDGVTVYSKSGGVLLDQEVDVSTYSGEHTIEVESTGFYMDNVRFVARRVLSPKR